MSMGLGAYPFLQEEEYPNDVITTILKQGFLLCGKACIHLVIQYLVFFWVLLIELKLFEGGEAERLSLRQP